MKAVFSGIFLAAAIAAGAAYVLDANVQRGADVAFATSGARL